MQPVNTDLVPNYADVFPGLKDQPWNTVDGVAVRDPARPRLEPPHVQHRGRGSRPDLVAADFEADSQYAGEVTAYDSPIFIADAARVPDGHAARPRHHRPLRPRPDAVRRRHRAPDPAEALIGEYWSDYLKQMSGLQVRGVGAGHDVAGDRTAPQAEDTPVEVVKPKEGSTGWSDTWMVGAKDANINCSYKRLDWIVSPEANAAVAEYFGEAPANSKACDLTTDESFCDTYHAEDEAWWTDVYYWNTPSTECLDGRTDVQCVPTRSGRSA